MIKKLCDRVADSDDVEVIKRAIKNSKLRELDQESCVATDIVLFEPGSKFQGFLTKLNENFKYKITKESENNVILLSDIYTNLYLKTFDNVSNSEYTTFVKITQGEQFLDKFYDYLCISLYLIYITLTNNDNPPNECPEKPDAVKRSYHVAKKLLYILSIYIIKIILKVLDKKKTLSKTNFIINDFINSEIYSNNTTYPNMGDKTLKRAFIDNFQTDAADIEVSDDGNKTMKLTFKTGSNIYSIMNKLYNLTFDDDAKQIVDLNLKQLKEKFNHVIDNKNEDSNFFTGGNFIICNINYKLLFVFFYNPTFNSGESIYPNPINLFLTKNFGYFKGDKLLNTYLGQDKENFNKIHNIYKETIDQAKLNPQASTCDVDKLDLIPQEGPNILPFHNEIKNIVDKIVDNSRKKVYTKPIISDENKEKIETYLTSVRIAGLKQLLENTIVSKITVKEINSLNTEFNNINKLLKEDFTVSEPDSSTGISSDSPSGNDGSTESNSNDQIFDNQLSRLENGECLNCQIGILRLCTGQGLSHKRDAEDGVAAIAEQIYDASKIKLEELK